MSTSAPLTRATSSRVQRASARPIIPPVGRATLSVRGGGSLHAAPLRKQFNRSYCKSSTQADQRIPMRPAKLSTGNQIAFRRVEVVLRRNLRSSLHDPSASVRPVPMDEQ